MTRLTTLVIILAASPAWAQRVELAPVVTYITSVTLDQTAEGVDELRIDDGVAWGARGTFFLSERVGIEGIWTYQETALEMTSGTNTAEVFEMTLNQIHGNVVYQLGAADGRLKPFIFGGLGATFFAADDLQSETKLSWDVGAGVKWFFQQRVGIEGRVRYRPTELGDESSETCGPFGFCQGSLKHVDIGAGVVFRF